MNECAKCKELEEQVYRLLGELQVANLKLSMISQIKDLKHLIDSQTKEQK